MAKKLGINRIFFVASFFTFILPVASLNAEQIDVQRWKVNVGATETITGPDGVCQKVTNNNCAGPVFVPIKSAAEWQGFLANKPPCVSLGSCCVPVGCGGRCGWVDNGCGTLIDCGSCQQTWINPRWNPADVHQYQIIHGLTNAQDFCAANGMSYVTHTDGKGEWAGEVYARTRRDGIPLDSIFIWYAAHLEGVSVSELQMITSVTCTK